MALSVNWTTRVITVPQADLTFVETSAGGLDIYELDINTFRLELQALLDDEGMPFPDTHQHNTEVTISGITLARVIEIINGYTIEFEDGLYGVNLVGANSNLGDVAIPNLVNIRSNNSAGLVVIPGGGLDAGQDARLVLMEKILRNLLITDPVTGIMTLYDDDSVTPLLSSEIYESTDPSIPYRGQGTQRRERME